MFLSFSVTMVLIFIFTFLGFRSLRPSLLCILGDLAGGGSEAVAFCVSVRGQVAGERRHAKRDRS